MEETIRAVTYSFRVRKQWRTGIRGLMRGMATIPQGKEELLVVRDRVGRPQVSLG